METARAETFGQRVKRLRLDRKIRQTDLAAQARISWRHLIRIEQDSGGVTKAATIARLAEALGITPDELTGDGDEDDEESDPVLTLDEFLERRVRQLMAKTTEPTASLAEATAGSDSLGG